MILWLGNFLLLLTSEAQLVSGFQLGKYYPAAVDVVASIYSASRDHDQTLQLLLDLSSFFLFGSTREGYKTYLVWSDFNNRSGE